MTKNKSIDGLAIGHAKNNSPRKTAPLSTATKKKKITIKVASEEKSIPETNLKPKQDLSLKDDSESNLKLDEKVNVEVKSSVEDFLEPVTILNLDKKSAQDESSVLNKKETRKNKSPKIKKEKKKVSKARKIITSILLALLIAIIGVIVWALIWGNDIIAKITGGKETIWDAFGVLTTETYEPLKTDANGRTNILAFGTSGYNMEGDEGNGVHAGAQLSDSIMLISINQDNGDIAMLSLPRDLKVSRTCTATGKVNEVYWCNNQRGDDENSGAQALMNEVGSILGVDFQYFVHVNWGSLVQLVDILGGISVTLDEDINDYNWTGAVYKAGVPYTLNGEQALGLARARHGTVGGDFSRGNSQQKILIGIKNKIYEKNLSLTDLVNLVSVLGDNLRTDLSLSDMKTAAHLTAEFDLDSMRQISLMDYNNNIHYMTTGMINGISYVLPKAGVGNYREIQKYITKMISSDPRVYENPRILILNGTDEDGLAKTEKILLEEEGYENIDVDNAPDGTYMKREIYSLSEKVPGTLAMLKKYYQIDSYAGDELPDGIDTDYDIVIILGEK